MKKSVVLFSFLLACEQQTHTFDSADNTMGQQHGYLGGAGGCATSCALDGKSISQEEWLNHLDTWAKQDIGVSTKELDTLLFYAKESKEWLSIFGSDLDQEHYHFLVHELSRNKVDIEMRLIDEFGEIRGELDSRPFFLKEKQHLSFSKTQTLGWFETGGKVKRVGLAHLWSRW